MSGEPPPRMAPSHPHPGLLSLPPEVLVQILGILHEEDERGYERAAVGRSLQRVVYGESSLLPLRLVSRTFRGAADAAVRSFAYSFMPYSLSRAVASQHSCEAAWWGFFMHAVLPRWHNLVSVRLVFDWNARHLCFVLQGLCRSCPGLQTLLLQVADCVTDTGIGLDMGIGSLASLHKLSRLHLKGFKTYSHSWATGLALLSQLKELHIDGARFSELSAPAGLTDLEIRDSYGPGGHPAQLQIMLAGGLSRLSVHNVSVQTLELPPTLTTLALEGVSYRSFTLPLLPELTSLSLEDMEMEHLAWLSGSCKLTSLVLQSVERLAEVPDLSHMTELRCLRLRSIRSPAELRLPDLRQLSSLDSLHITDVPLHDFPKLGPPLRELRLEELGSLSSLEGLSLATSLESLHMEDVMELVELPDLSSLVHLRQVTLRDMGLSSLQRLAGLGDSFQELQLVGLEGLSLVDALSKNCSLTMLVIDRGGIEWDRSMSLPMLSRLQVSHSSAQTLPLGGFPKLEELVLHKCSFLKVLEDLRELRKLRSLEITECASLRELVIEPGHSALQVLHLVKCIALEKVVGLGELSKSAQMMVNRCDKLRLYFGNNAPCESCHKSESEDQEEVEDEDSDVSSQNSD